MSNNDQDLTSYYIKKDIDKKLKSGIEALEETRELIQNDTIDSYLRYFQTGLFNGEHLPTLILKNNKTVQRLLAEKLRSIIEELGFEWDEEELKENGLMQINYRESEYRLNFAYFDPFKRSIIIRFDIGEMERDRDIKVHQIKQRRLETEERLDNTLEYLDMVGGTWFRRLINFKNKKTIERLEGNAGNIAKEIDELEEELEELMINRILLENIKAKLPEMKDKVARFGIDIEFIKGETYEI